MLAAALLAGCAGAGNPRIPDSGGGWAGASIPHWPADTPYVFAGAANLCIDRPGRIEITDVALEHSENGLRVDAFGTRPQTPPDGGSYPQPDGPPETLWDIGFVPGHTTIDTVCPDQDDDTADAATGVTTFGVHFVKPTYQTARGAIIRITYRSGNRAYTHRIGFELILCERQETTPECAFRDSHHYQW